MWIRICFRSSMYLFPQLKIFFLSTFMLSLSALWSNIKSQVTISSFIISSDVCFVPFSYYFNAFCGSTCKKYYLRFSKATSLCIPNLASKKFVMMQWFSCCWAGYGLLGFDLQLEKDRLGGHYGVAECRAVCP
jgi:hypothetical protein